MKFISKNNIDIEIKQIELLEEVVREFNVPEFTTQIFVENRAIPHSHPVLTLNTRTQDKLEMLQTLVHEQFHWYASSHKNYENCINYLKLKYIDDGEHNKSGKHPNSYWEHIIVCFNTKNWLRDNISTTEIDHLYNKWQPYPTLEMLIANTFDNIRRELEKFDIIYKS